MDSTRLDYTLTNPHTPQSSRYTPTTTVKNQDRQVFFSVSSMPSQLEPNSFDLARTFVPLSVTQPTEAPYPYPRPCDILSPDQHRGPFPQSQAAPLTDVTTFIYDSPSSSYPPDPQPSQCPYNLSSAHEVFPVNMNQDLSAHSVSLSLNSSFDLAIQTPPTFSLVPPDYGALRRYHEDQRRQHAQVLQQLTRSRDGRRQSSTEHANGNGVLSASLEITPTGRRAEFYHAASSIPMGNIRQPRPPDHPSHYSQQSKFLNQYQYPYYHNQDLGYPDNCRSEPLDGSPTHVLTTQGLGIYESAPQQPSTFPMSSKTMHISSPEPAISTTTAHESSMYTMRSGPRSNAIRSVPQSSYSFEGTAGASKVHPTTNISDVASITPQLSALTNGAGHEDVSLGIPEEGSNLIEIESEMEDEEKLTSERIPKEDGTENVVSNHSGTSSPPKRRDRKQTEGSGSIWRRKTSDSKNDSAIKDGLSPPTKKRKKSKMHECQVCHKNFPRPSGLKTHMNTHNNERPYPCPYLGCNRSFGVRSNAKRHLRTHGVIPPQNTGAQPYVVDFSTPMVLEQDGGLGLNGGEGTSSCNDDDDDGPEGGPRTQRPARAGRGRGRQFKLRWMPPSSASRSGAPKGKGKKKKPAGSPSVGPVKLQDDVDVKPSFPRSPSQRNSFLGYGEGDQEGEDAGVHTDGEEDTEMDFGDEGDDQDEESEVDRSEEEFGASTAMRAGVVHGSSQHSQASSSRTSLSSSLSASVSTSTGSTSATSLRPSASSGSFASASPIRAEYFVESGP